MLFKIGWIGRWSNFEMKKYVQNIDIGYLMWQLDHDGHDIEEVTMSQQDTAQPLIWIPGVDGLDIALSIESLREAKDLSKILHDESSASSSEDRTGRR